MGAFCCCFYVRDPEENNSSNMGFIRTLFSKNAAVCNEDRTPTCPGPNLQQDELALTHENGEGQSHNDIEQLRGGDCMVQETVTARDKSNVSESSIGVPDESVDSAVHYMFVSQDDEDVCPTCLEEYSFENPRIITQCRHHYHLGCIYEWKERSENCPACGRVMAFDEVN